MHPVVRASEQEAERGAARKQGRAIFGAEFRVRDAEGNDIPRDGAAFSRRAGGARNQAARTRTWATADSASATRS